MAAQDAEPQVGQQAGVPDDEDLAEFVQKLLQKMQTRFQGMSQAILARIDEMGSRIDELERNIGDLMKQVNEDDDAPPSGAAATGGD